MIAIPASLQSTRWRWVTAIWIAGALFDASQAVLQMQFEGRHHPWLPIFGVELVAWLPWALATPAIVWLARQYPISRGLTVRALAVHLVAYGTITAVAEAWSAMLQILINPWEHRQWPTFLDTWSTTIVYQAVTFLIAYALILTLTYLVAARDGMARHMMESARLNEELSKSQLAALRRQIEPHFMYNALNSVAGLVRDQRNDAAVSMIVGLSEFLRRASEDSHRSQVTLAEEVEYLQRYIDIQQVRFGERLKVSVDIPQELLRAQVPNLLLQPLVENAIKHGIAKRIAGGAVRVAGASQDGNLALSVYNDGPVLPAQWEVTPTGVGIANLRTRLRILHGDQANLQLKSAEPGGVEVLVTLPFKEV
jgi:two-component system LytT family sensor kinase